MAAATPALLGAFGVLDEEGDGTASILPLAALASRIGDTFHCAAVAYDPVGPTPRLSSIARAVTIVP